MAEKAAEKIIKLRKVRCAFLHVYKKRPKFDPKNEAEVEKYENTAILDPKNPVHAESIKEIVAEMRRLAKEKEIDEETLKSVFNGAESSKIVLCAGKGDTKKDKSGKTLDGFAGMYFIVARNETRPVVVDRNRNPVAEGDSGAPYAGCYVNMNVRLYAWANKGKKGISAELRSVQYDSKGPRFGRAPVDAEQEFEKLGDEPGDASASSGEVGDDEFLS